MCKMLLAILAFMVLTISQQVLAVEPTKQPTLADYQVGEKWVWQYKGITTKGEIRADGTDSKEIISQNDKLYMLTANETIPLAELVKPVTSKTARYNWPLKVGKKWTFKEEWLSADGTKGSTIQNVEVLSYQRETVSAGKFMAYTIHYQGNISNSRGYSAATEDTLLYAPKLKTFIKLIQKQDDYLYIEELVRYRNKKE